MALAAQGFGGRAGAAPSALAVRRTAERLGLFQIDSVNVLVRAHYMPAFSRLGPYDRAFIDSPAWGKRPARRYFEYWAHECSLLPLSLHPLLRWRMAQAERGEAGWARIRVFAREKRAAAEAILARLRAEGPLSAGALAEAGTARRSGWWEWSEAKAALEFLFWAGLVTTATRQGNFERVYDLPERVIPAEILALPTPAPDDARRALLAHAARALGVATAAELRDYFRLRPAEASPALAALRDEGVVVPVAVPGWPEAFRHRDARCPRQVACASLLAPFDPLVWETRARAAAVRFSLPHRNLHPGGKTRARILRAAFSV